MKTEEKKVQQPPQTQNRQPGIESEMTPAPEFEVKPTDGQFTGKVVIVTGGDSGIGRAVAVAFAREGADVVVSYFDEHGDAQETKNEVEKYHRKCLLIPGDLSDAEHCNDIVDKAVSEFGRIDVLVNNAAVQFPQEGIENITPEQLDRTFRINIYSMFFLVRAALKHLKEGSSIINTASVTAYRGNADLIDYSSTKGAIVAFTRSLSLSLLKKGIRVNAVAPGPIWTPLIPATFDADKVAKFGSDVPMGRVGQPNEVASCYIFLASEGASYISGQVLHPNGGESLNS